MGRISLLLLLLAAIGFGVGCSINENAGSNTAANISSLQKHPVFIMAGRIKAGETAAISSRITARVNSVNVDVGSRVEKGALLIQLDAGDLAAQAAQARAGVEQAAASIEGAEISRANAQSNCERYQELFNAGAISEAQMDQARAELATADSTLNSARAKLSQAEASLALASEQLANGTIVSPISGVISAKNINNGEIALSGVQLLNVVNADSLSIDAYLPASLVDQTSSGQEVLIRVSELPGKTFGGQILAIDSIVDGKNGNLLVKVQFADRDPLLKPGMFAEVGIKNEEARQ